MSLSVRAAYISWMVRGFWTPILRTWVQKSTLLLQNRGHAEVLKIIFFRKIRNAGAVPPLYLGDPPGSVFINSRTKLTIYIYLFLIQLMTVFHVVHTKHLKLNPLGVSWFSLWVEKNLVMNRNITSYNKCQTCTRSHYVDLILNAYQPRSTNHWCPHPMGQHFGVLNWISPTLSGHFRSPPPGDSID